MALFAFLVILLGISFFPSLSYYFQKNKSNEELHFLEIEALDGNLSAAEKIAQYYMNRDIEKARYWTKIVVELEKKK